MKSSYWQYGEQALFAKTVGVSRPYLSGVLSGVRRVSVPVARRWELASRALFGVKREIPWDAWLCNDETLHPAFHKNRGSKVCLKK